MDKLKEGLKSAATFAVIGIAAGTGAMVTGHPLGLAAIIPGFGVLLGCLVVVLINKR
jgi:hypothetical protein